MTRQTPTTTTAWSLAIGVAIVLAAATPSSAATRYVSPSGAANPPYTNWTDAATRIQDAIDVSDPGDVVLVTNGTYSAGQSTPPGTNLACRVALTNAITVRSVNGYAVTQINGDPNIFAPVRCAYVGPGAQLIGFTLTSGCADILTEGTLPRTSGGGVMCEGGTVENCRISSNLGLNGGGALCYNGGTLRNCLIANNTCFGSGGGVYVYNGGLIQNCTIVTNASTAGSGGGIRCYEGGTVENSILYDNRADVTGANWDNSGTGMVYQFVCTVPAVGGVSNLTSNPLFFNPAGGDHRLQFGSPCIDVGVTQAWMEGQTDLAGLNRVANGLVDLGAFEYRYLDIVATAGLNGAISPSGTIHVAQQDNVGFIMFPDPNYHVSNVVVDSVSIGPTNDYTFTNVTAPHTIEVYFSIDQYTLVVSSPYGTPVPDGTNIYDYGATADCAIADSPVLNGLTQYVASGWIGTGSIPPAGATTNVSAPITNDSTLAWLWTTNYWLDTTAGTNGSVDTTDGWYVASSVVPITATPDVGYHFTNWSGDVSSTNNPLNLAMDQPYAVTANFAINLYDILATAGTNGSIAPSGVVTVVHGESTNFAIAADTNYHIADVLVDGASVGPTNAYAFDNVVTSHTIHATFAIDTYTVVVNTAYGVADPAGTTLVDYGTNLTCTIESPVVSGTTQFVATGWIGTGSFPPSGAGTNVTATITNHSELTWLWSTNYWLHPVAGPDGALSLGDGWYTAGSSVTITATPAPRATFSYWTGDVPPADTNSNPLDLDMDQPRAVTAWFTITTHYASTNGAHIAPYTNWATAATNLQAVVEACEDGARVLVSNGLYRLSSPLVITNGIRIESVNGPAVTTIDGDERTGCLVSDNPATIVDGFTLTRGWARQGGGVWLSGGVVRNCLIVNNAAERGGGAFLTSNATLRSCFVTGNTADWGGGAAFGSSGTVQNCTIVSNTALTSGGGLYGTATSTVRNCIVYFNTARVGTNTTLSGTLSATYNRSVPLLTGTGNSTNHPQLTPDYRLKSTSPCIDGGVTNGAPATDLEGEARWDDSRRANVISSTDIGADEFVDTDLDNMADAWELLQFGALTNSNGTADPDGDSLTDLQEYNLALCPTNAITYADTLNDRWKAANSFVTPHDWQPLPGTECVRLGTRDTAGDARGVAVAGNVAFVADGTNGLVAIDLSLPTNPVVVGGCDTPGFAHAVALDGAYAYLADGTNGLVVADVSLPTNCVRIGGRDTPGDSRGLARRGAYAYLADGSNGLVVMDVSLPTNPVVVGGYNTAGFAAGVAVTGLYAFVADGTNGLVVIDVSVPAACTWVGGWSGSGYVAGVAVTNSLAVLADRTNGLVIVDVSIPASPARAGLSFAPAPEGLGLDGADAAVAGRWGLDVFSLADPTNAVHLGRLALSQPAYGVQTTGNLAVVANGSNGLQVARWTVRDSDRDGMSDAWEVQWWGDLAQGPTNDFDGDTLSNWGEYLLGIDPTGADSDADGIPDGDEVNLTLTDPRRFDTDGDGTGDGAELALGTDPRSSGSFPATISGTVTYAGTQPGTVWISATNAGTSASTSMAVPGAYSISNRPTLTNYWIDAYRDADGNAAQDSWEPSGSYAGNPLSLTNHAAGINLTLVDPIFSHVVRGDPLPLGSPLPYGYASNNLAAATVVTNSVGWLTTHVTTQYVCTGWTGTGSFPPSGTDTSVVVTLTNHSALTWTWQPTNVYLAVQAGANGFVSGTSGWHRVNSLVTNAATPSNGYHFIGWTGTLPPGDVTNNPLVLLMDEARSVTANFAINLYDITGTVGPNGSIVPDGTIQVAHGGSTTVTIAPSPNHHVQDVLVDSVSIGPTNSVTFDPVVTSHTVHATFAIDLYDIVITASANGTVSPSGTVQIAHGGTTNVVITPNTNYYILDVLVDAGSVGTPTNVTFSNVTANHTLDASFDNRHRLVVTSRHGATVPAGTNLYAFDTLVDAAVSNSPVVNGTTQYVCTGWTGTGSVPPSGAGTNFSFTITNNSTLAWQWSTSYWLNATSGPNGAIDASNGWYAAGSNVTLTATPSNHHHFTAWAGTLTSTNNPLLLTLNQAHALTASFAIDTFTITAGSGANGTIVPSGAVVVPYDGTTNFTLTPNANYHISNVVVDGVSIGPTNQVAFLNVTNDRSISVAFAIDTYDLVVTSPYGTPSPATGTTAYGWNTILTGRLGGSPAVNGMTQLVCTGWTGTGSVPPSGSDTNTGGFNLRTNSSITWNWQTRYALSATNGPNGSVAASNGWVDAGTTGVTLTAAAATNYHFVNWTGDLTSTDNPLVLTMNRGYALTANFELNTYDITASAGPNGSIAPGGVVPVPHGGTTNFTIAASANHYISNVVVDGVSVGATNSYRFLNVTNPHTISATFAVSNCTLGVVSRHGTPTPPVGTNLIAWNAPVSATLAGSPVLNGATQYVAAGWTGTGSVPPSGAGTQANFTLLTNSTITWQWITNYWLQAGAGPDGSVDATNRWCRSGTNVTLTATAMFGSIFAGWSGDVPPANSNDNPLTLAMTQARAVTANFAISPYYVSLSGQHIWPYTSWATAATNIQAAVNVAEDGKTVLVASGTYSLSAMLYITNGITVRSVSGPGSTIIDGNRAVRCLYLSHSNALVTGFTFRRGDTSQNGGGVYLDAAGTLYNCTVSDNDAANYGGGVYVYNGGTVQSCTVSGNRSLYGGGIQCENAGLVTNCTVSGNQAMYGAGVRCRNGGHIDSCTIRNNTASLDGGGLQFVNTGSARNCTFDGNVSANYGGGVYAYLGGVVDRSTFVRNRAYYGGGIHCEQGGIVSNCSFNANQATYGGGIRCRDGGIAQNCLVSNNTATAGGGIELVNSGSAVNCLITGNSASDYAGGLYLYYGGTARNCTIARNAATNNAGGLFCESGGTVENTIIYTNAAAAGANHASSGSGMTFATSCSQPLLPGTGNLAADPLFVSPTARDFHLRAASPCRDTGINQPWMTTATDADGNPRLVNGTVDRGALEWFDGDGDGLSDPEETLLYGTDPVNPDSDGDGSSDGDELIAGTSPTSGDQVFSVEEAPIANDFFVLSWNSLTGRLYTVRRTAGLSPVAWSNVVGYVDLPGTGGIMSCTNSTVSAVGFFRINVRLPTP